MELNLKVNRQWTYWLMLVLTVSFCCGDTDPRDVLAINTLYAALGSPPLTGWVPLGGDPCMESWQGVYCVISNITQILLNNSSLGGELGTALDSFTSMIVLDLSDNHIGGTIPANLPPTMRNFSLSGNQLTGSIPDLSAFGQLTELSLKKNNLTGQIPDSFQQLNELISMDLSGNNLTGPLPPSLGNLSSLTTLLLQDNQLTGGLDILQDLPLTNLNVMNNQFSGPIPPKFLTMPNFSPGLIRFLDSPLDQSSRISNMIGSSGNPFNTSVLPSPPDVSPAMTPRSPEQTHKQPVNTSLTPQTSPPAKSNTTTRNTILVAALVVVILLGIVLGLWFGIARWCKSRQEGDKFNSGHVKKSYNAEVEKPKYAPQASSVKIPNVGDGQNKRVKDVKQITPVAASKDVHLIDMTRIDVPPPRHFSNENITLKPFTPKITTSTNTSSFPSSVRCFTVASLQQYTNSFSQDNLLGEGMLGTVYRAELPDGKVVAVKKLNNAASRQPSKDDFAQLVSLISKIQHENIVKLVGYCFEYGQRLIVYEYCNEATLYDALHLDDEIHKKLSWGTRVKIALGAAKALEYLHETCQPPIVHKNFISDNILLDEKFNPIILDCGLASLIDSYTAQSSSGYGAPELELGTYTLQSDVFNFGVVMLELLTGRKSFDSAQPRGEQFLVRWAIPQLHDIDALSKMVDPSLQGSYPSKSLSRFADIISLCVQAEPEFRPPISEIVQDLFNMIQREP